MEFSFYRNLTWVIGVLVAIEILLQRGVDKLGLILLVADLVLVLLLTYLFHVLNQTQSADDARAKRSIDQLSRAQALNDRSDWQKRHDQWWQAHRQQKPF